MSHTPGPWIWRGNYLMQDCVDERGEVITNPYSTPAGHPVADDGSAGDEYASCIDTDGPDAHLIAAAPDLLVCLKDAISVLNDGMEHCKDPNCETCLTLNRWKAAIAKAEGAQ